MDEGNNISAPAAPGQYCRSSDLGDLTKSPRALKIFYQGMNECYIRQNWEKGLALLGQSVQQDSTFAYAYSQVIDAN